MEGRAAQLVIVTVALVVIAALLNRFRRGIKYDRHRINQCPCCGLDIESEAALWIHDVERRKEKEAEESQLSTEELVKRKLKESKRKWGSKEELAASFATAIQRLKRAQSVRMKEVSGLRRKLMVERHESMLPWKTMDGRTAEAAMRMAINVLDESFERLTEVTGQYSAGLRYYVDKGQGVRQLEQARTEFGDVIVSDIIKLVAIITELRLHPATAKPWTETQEVLDDGDRLDEWARNQVWRILSAEEMAAQRAYMAHDLLMDLEMSYSAAEPDLFRKLRMEKELRLMGFPSPPGMAQPHPDDTQTPPPERPTDAQHPLTKSAQQRLKLYKDRIARDSVTTFWEAEVSSEDSNELFGATALKGNRDARQWPDSSMETPGGDVPPPIKTITAEKVPERGEVPAPMEILDRPQGHAAEGQVPRPTESRELKKASDGRKEAPAPPPRSDRTRLSGSAVKSPPRTDKAGSPPVKPTSTGSERIKDKMRASGKSPKKAGDAPTSGAQPVGAHAAVAGPTSGAAHAGGKGRLNKLGLTLVAVALLIHGGSGAVMSETKVEEGATREGAADIPDPVTHPSNVSREIERAELPEGGPNGGPGRERYTDEIFTAYDCRDLRYPERRVIDVTRIGDCPDSERDFEEARNVTVAVVQRPVPIRVVAHRCRAWMEKTAHGCGNLHINYGSVTVEARRVFRVEKQDCFDLMRDKVWECKADVSGGCFAEKGSGPRKVKIGSENVFDWVSRGSHNGKYYCHDATTWTYKNKRYGDPTPAYEKTKVHMLVEFVYGALDRESGKVDFPKLGLFDVNYSEGAKDGGDEGYVYWQPREHTCGEELTIIANGSAAQIYLPTHRHHAEPYRDAIVLLETDNRVGGFLIKAPENKCVNGCFRTQVTSILLCLDEVHQFSESLSGIEMGEPDPQTRAEMGVVVTYSLFESKLWTQNKFRMITEKLCELSRGSWWSLISSTQQHNREMDYLLRKMDRLNPQSTLSRRGDVGYNIITAAGAIIIEECPAVAVRLTTYSNCTENIPVRVAAIDGGDELAFVDPVTRTLEPYPRVTVCNDAYPSHFLINDKWICSSPKYQACDEIPTKLAPDVSWEDGVTMEDVASFKPTLYDEQTWTDARNYRKAVHAREALIKELIIERTQHGTAASGSGLGFSLVGISWERFVAELNNHLWGPSTFIVRSLVFILAGVIVLMMLRWFLVTTLQICRYVVKRGPGFWILYALYNSLFVTFSVPQKILQATHDMMQRDVDQIIPPGEALDEARVRVLKRRFDQMEVRLAELAQENHDLQKLVTASQNMKTAEEKMSMLRDSISEENARRQADVMYFKRLRMGLETHEEPEGQCTKDASWPNRVSPRTEGRGSWSTEVESTRQSMADLALSSAAASPSSTDSDVPDLESDSTVYRPPGVYQPRLPHGLIDLGTDSDAPGKKDEE